MFGFQKLGYFKLNVFKTEHITWQVRNKTCDQHENGHSVPVKYAKYIINMYSLESIK